MKKYIYGLAKKFDFISGIVIDGIEKCSYTDSETVTYAKEVAMTLEHNPKQTLTTTAAPEGGELILVQTNKGLYFRYAPLSVEGLRAYRHVKHRRLRQCSCIFRRGKLKRDIKNETRAKKLHPILNDMSLYKDKKICLYEICLTNNPKDTKTFCTTDKDHPLLKGIEWITNIINGEEDYWKEEVESEAFKEWMRDFEESRKKADKKIQAALERRVERIERAAKQKLGGILL
ncbi:HK97 family phage prohead protease [Sporosarcina limicola]|uniref:Prohead serine protease domain-containing protein n=1 Tax=Sporosarcina limicola TaxID=34101 RepID=A0A927MPQ3_9BACL|nr:HK97 family phage prohead protease [Sporosarcina limicola]MBE1557002.1 hypothetical protein [Sporosarcina limicola]